MEHKMRKKLNSAGMSLIEIVVVVLILGIMAGASTAGIAFMRSMDSSGAADSIVALLDRTKMNALALEEGADVRLVIYKDDNAYYGKIEKMEGGVRVELSCEKIAGNRVGITVYDTMGGTLELGEGTASAIFTFQKSNGAFTSTNNKIVVSGSKTYTIYLVTDTGRSYIEPN